MGQYYVTVNPDKGEYIMPHRFGNGLKLLEFACSRFGTPSALALLLADGNGRGGGDLSITVTDDSEHHDYSEWFENVPGCLRVEHEFQIPVGDLNKQVNYKILVPKIVGRWAGDRIIVAGDYADDGKFLTEEQCEKYREKMGDPDCNVTLYGYACEFFEDISHDVLLAMAFEDWMLPTVLEALRRDTERNYLESDDVPNSARNTLRQIQDLLQLTDEKVDEILDEKRQQSQKYYESLRPDMVLVARPKEEDKAEDED